MFFDEFPRFYETSSTSPYRGRLNLRYEAIFAENRDIFEGARVLDIASHDGRWSLAALKTGAARVVGIEARDDLVQTARDNVVHYGGDSGRCEFVAGDVFDVLSRQNVEADVVLCLGYLYHTLRYSELMRRIRDVNPRYLVIDTKVIPGVKHRFVRLRLDRTERERNAVADSYSYGDKTLVGWPTVPALEFMVEAFGFTIERFSDWGALLRDNPSLGGVRDYAATGRVTVRCASTS
jgi:ubiquinone/menaquinone biosynthesis C-methylase UbiE